MKGLSAYSERIPFEELSGLRPRAWLCVGSGFSREDVKALLLNRGIGFTVDAITSLPEIALKIAAQQEPALDSGRVLGALARQEILRQLLAEPRIIARCPELKKLRRQSGFFKKLDQAMQAGRMAFAHEQEGAVYDARLRERLGRSLVREELQTLSLAYEAWLDGNSLLDPVLLLRRAARLLAEREWPERLARPEAVHLFTAQHEESLERSFWDALGRHVPVVRTGPLAQLPKGGAALAKWRLERWHTLDDAAECLAQSEAEGGHESVVLIADQPGVRRSLSRATASWGVPLADPRDPTRLRWDEGLKWAALPLAVVARGYERGEVVSFLHGYATGAELPLWIGEIHSRGIRLGLGSYSGGKLTTIHARLKALDERLAGRRTCVELGEAHLEFLRESLAEAEGSAGLQWLVPFFEALWREFAQDMERVGQGKKKAPLLYWWERLQSRMAESPAPVERFKPEKGLAVYRLHQAPLQPLERVYMLGLPSRWLAGEGLGDYWFSEREREVLGAEFGVRSAAALRQERLTALGAWVAQAREVVWLDAAYDADGREREGIEAVLQECAGSLGFSAQEVPEPEEHGAHPRWMASYGALRPVQPLSVKLPPSTSSEISATAIDSYSRCGLQALAYHRWKLKDVRDPDTELWPEARGNILHLAAKLLLESRGPEGEFSLSPREALDRAWSQENPRGLLRSPRAEAYVRSRMALVLETFCEKEREYFARAPSRVISLDDARFRLTLGEITLVGTPDRIDEHPQGLFVVDYKTSSSLPNGTDMLELGYRLQLPFYALAARQALSKPVAGLQFIELNKKGGRGNGIFFKKFNGKEAGRLTQLTARSKSLLSVEPDEAWSQLEERLRDHARRFVSGEFAARPKKAKECDTCQVSDLCGFRRLTERPGAEGEGTSE